MLRYESLIELKRILISKIRVTKFFILNKNLYIGRNFVIGRHSYISRKNKLFIGDNVYIGNNCHLSANAIIGNNVLIASYVSLVGGDHNIDYIEGPIRNSGRAELKQIVICDDVWIGHGSIIMHGVKIGTGAVIAAGSIVTKNIPENEVWGGNTAKFIRNRKFK